MATLTEWETTVAGLPGYQKHQCAGAALRVRELVGRGIAFAEARDSTASNRRHFDQLEHADQLAAFKATTGL